MLISQVDLDGLGLGYGDGSRLTGLVSPGSVELGGQAYGSVPAEPDFILDISRTNAGFALRLRFGVALEGPCFRCLEPASARVEIDVREVDQPPEGVAGAARVHVARPGSGEEEETDEDEISAAELLSPYVEDGMLDLARWSRDALILNLPNQILCREGCLGLCSYCGESLNGADPGAHDHGQDLDPRWAKLRDLT